VKSPNNSIGNRTRDLGRCGSSYKCLVGEKKNDKRYRYEEVVMQAAMQFLLRSLDLQHAIFRALSKLECFAGADICYEENTLRHICRQFEAEPTAQPSYSHRTHTTDRSTMYSSSEVQVSSVHVITECVLRQYTASSPRSTIYCSLFQFTVSCLFLRRPGHHSRYSDSLRAGRSGDRIPVGARFSAPVHTGPPILLYNRYRVFPGGKAAGAWC
jgi:hypothetical protein